MSTSSGTSSTQEEAASVFPFGAGYTAPPPTPLASAPAAPHLSRDFIQAPSPLLGKSVNDNENSFPSSSSNLSSPPSKEDLDALAQYLMQQSLRSTPNLLASPSLHRKRRTIAAAVQPDNEIMDGTSAEKEVLHVANSRNDIYNGDVALQTYSYAGGFCKESRREIGKACQEVGAFYIFVQDAESGLAMLRERHGADDESMVVEGGLVPLSQLLTACTSQDHQQDNVLDFDALAFDSAVDTTTFRDTMTRFAKLLFRISKDILRFLLEDLSIETQANIRGHCIKPLLYIHGNVKQELHLDDDDDVLFISHDIDTHEGEKRALLLARLGTRLQTWSQGKYKAPFSRSPCYIGSGEVCIQVALKQHY